jgi:polysaccharide export outer membrane protein
MKSFTFLFIIIIATLSSCKTQKIVIDNYLQKLDTATTRVVSMPDPVIQKNDLLSIKVYSLSADPRTDMFYNLPEQAESGGGTSAASGFLVDANGNIEYPRLGIIEAEGLTKSALAQVIKRRLDTILKSPSVLVRFLNYRVTVLGEVRSPGSFTIPTERVTILEALGLAGDITDFGNKNIVRIAREKNEQMEIGYIDLTSQGLFTSPYFRLQQNDVVFVEQTRRKTQQEERQTVLQQVSIATSIITTVAILLNIFR